MKVLKAAGKAQKTIDANVGDYFVAARSASINLQLLTAILGASNIPGGRAAAE